MIQERIFIIIIACLLDLVFGDPHWLWHPVQGMGWLIDHVEAWMAQAVSDTGRSRRGYP